MTAPPPEPPPHVPSQDVEPAAVDCFCRAPLFTLLAGAAAWLFVATLLGLLNSLKFHAPGFLADDAALSYGRVHAAVSSALVYGFAIPAALAIGLEIMARDGRSRVAMPGAAAIGAALWHLGVFVGILGILAGDYTGFEALPLPRYAAALLFLGYIPIGISMALTLHSRRSAEISAPQWFLLAALLWFPWILSTAALLLLVSPVRGVEQSIIDWWYSANLGVVWSGLAGLAVIFHFLKSAAAPARKDYRPLFVFWTLLLFGSWAGIPQSAPVPAWIPVVSSIATVLLAVPALAVAVMLCGPSGAEDDAQAPVTAGRPPRSPHLRFLWFGAAAWFVATVMRIIVAVPALASFTQFTWFVSALSQLNTFGFLAMTLFGAIYEAAPRISGEEWPLPGAVRAHFWCAAIGVLLLVAPLAAGGIVQGILMNNPGIPVRRLTEAMLPFLRVSTLGDLLLLLSSTLLALNLAGLLLRFGLRHLVPAYRNLSAKQDTGRELAEVNR